MKPILSMRRRELWLNEIHLRDPFVLPVEADKNTIFITQMIQIIEPIPLCDRLDGTLTGAPVTRELKSELIVRSSTAAPRPDLK